MKLKDLIKLFLLSLFVLCGCQITGNNYEYKFVPSKESVKETNHLLIDSYEEKEEISYLSLDEYEIEYFDNNALLIINLGGDSGSVRYKVGNINIKNNIFNIEVIKMYPKAVTLDLVYKTLLIEISKEEANLIIDVNIKIVKKYSLI